MVKLKDSLTIYMILQVILNLHRHTRVSLVMFAPECDEWEVTPIAFSICMKY